MKQEIHVAIIQYTLHGDLIQFLQQPAQTEVFLDALVGTSVDSLIELINTAYELGVAHENERQHHAVS